MINVSTYESAVEDNVTISELLPNSSKQSDHLSATQIIQCAIASVGIVANLTVIIVFLNHKKLRRKVPNIFIIYQVSAATRGFFILESVGYKSFITIESTSYIAIAFESLSKKFLVILASVQSY